MILQKVDLFLFYFLIFLNIFACLGLLLSKKKPSKRGKIICPCKKMAENGSLSTICIYAAIGGFFYSVLSIGFIGFNNLILNCILLLTLLSAFLGWKLKAD